jgi:hypothetical protein
MTTDLDPTFVLSNHIEAVFWTAIGIACAVRAIRLQGAARIDARWAALTFILFGGSDLVEATTGAWWRPWWLLAWKALCIAVLLELWIRYARRRRAR